jgi:hypothetical protein
LGWHHVSAVTGVRVARRFSLNSTGISGCVRLIELLAQAIDFASDAWKRRPLGLALADARAFNRSDSASVWTEPELTPCLSI